MKTQLHHGRNVKRLRQILGIREEELAKGLEQTDIPELESRETIDDILLEKYPRN